MQTNLTRPSGLSQDAWEAIEYYGKRLEREVDLEDRPGSIGAAKELVECVARCTIEETATVVASNEDFPALIHFAQKALGRTAGADISPSVDVGKIAGATQSIAIRIGAIRNSVGTGHGRARVAAIDEEMAELAVDGALLWCRWALRRLGHVLRNYPAKLLAELASGVNREQLQEALLDVQLAEQPVDVQHAIGVAFGREAAGGFGNALAIGLYPAAQSTTLDEFTIDYRLGLVEGMIFNKEGLIALTAPYVPRLIDVVQYIPFERSRPAISSIINQMPSARWCERWRGEYLDAQATTDALRRDSDRLEPGTQLAMRELAQAMSDQARQNL